LLRKRKNDVADYNPYRSLHQFLLGALSGTLGAQSVLFAKCTAELILNSFAGNGLLFSHWQTYLVLFCMCGSIFLQIKFLNEGLREFNVLNIVPVFQSFWISVSVISGLIFFEECLRMSTVSCALFPLGVLLTTTGVYYLSSGVQEPSGTPKPGTDVSGKHRKKEKKNSSVDFNTIQNSDGENSVDFALSTHISDGCLSRRSCTQRSRFSCNQFYSKEDCFWFQDQTRISRPNPTISTTQGHPHPEGPTPTPTHPNPEPRCIPTLRLLPSRTGTRRSTIRPTIRF